MRWNLAAAGVYFALKANAAYQARGFGGSPITQDGVASSEMKAYFTSRSACMGQVPPGQPTKGS
jgi:hypothetical protein